jgi:hypothetical protein
MKNKTGCPVFLPPVLAVLLWTMAGLAGCGSAGAAAGEGAAERDLTIFLYYKTEKQGGDAFTAKQRFLTSSITPGLSAFYPAPYDFSGDTRKWFGSGDFSYRILRESDRGGGVLELSLRATNRAIRETPEGKGRRCRINFPLSDLDGASSRQPCAYAVMQGALMAKAEGAPRGRIELLSINYRKGAKRFEALLQVYPE